MTYVRHIDGGGPEWIEGPPFLDRKGEQSMGGDRAVSLTDVLGVIRDFEPIEPAGISAGTLSWELHQPETEISPLIERAAADGLLEPTGVDERSGQTLWRLTGQGHERIDGSSGSQ